MLTTSNKSINKGYVASAFGKVHYWTVGSGDALLLIHQSSSSGEEYAGLIPYLSKKYRLISFDWPGHGNSDDPDHELGVEEYTAAALSVLDHLEIKKCSVLGHHGGALLAMNIAYLQPERVHKLLLSGTSGPKTKEESEQFKKNLPVSQHQGLDRDGTIIAEAWRRYINYMGNADPETSLSPFLNKVMSKMRPYDAHFGVLGWDRNPALHSLRMPVLLIQGSRDTFVTRQEKLLDIIPNGQRVVIDDAGPFHYVGKSKESAEVIDDFLK